MVTFKTINTAFEKDFWSWPEWGPPVKNISYIERLKSVLRILLPLTPLSGTMEISVTGSNYPNAASNDQDGILKIIVTKGMLDKSNDASLAYMLGHELGHLVTGVLADNTGQSIADEFGLRLALKAGFRPKDLMPELNRVRQFDNGEMRWKALQKIIREEG